MSLSASEASKVKFYLGYDQVVADAWRGPNSFGITYAFERLDAEGEARVRESLTELEDLDTQIAAARGRLKAEQVGDLKLNARRELQTLRAEQREVAMRLARALGVDYKGDGPEGIVV